MRLVVFFPGCLGFAGWLFRGNLMFSYVLFLSSICGLGAKAFQGGAPAETHRQWQVFLERASCTSGLPKDRVDAKS